MKKLFLYAIMMAAITVSCNEMGLDPIQGGEELQPVPGVKMITETLTGGRDVETKVTINNSNGAFAWTKYDNVAVHVSKSDSHKYVLTKGDGGASIAAATAAFTVIYEEGYARDAFAVFPSTIVAENASNYGQSSTALDVTLPARYTLAQLTGETSPCPMIATNDPASSSWNFKQLCGLLRLTVNSIPPSTKRLEIDFDGKKVCGTFSIASPVTPGTSEIQTADDPSNDIITITKDGTDVTLNGSAWLDGLVLNIPLPTGDYTNITVTAYDALFDGNAVITKSSAFAFTSNRKNATKRTASFPVFSVSTSKRVIFAPGNLQATYDADAVGEKWTWSFAAHQYDYIGDASGNKLVNGTGKLSADGTVDLFFYSTTENSYGIAKSYSDGTFSDWGNINIDGKGSGYWCSLTGGDENSEWWYVFHNKDSYNHVGNRTGNRFTQAVINSDGLSVKGVILFPDGFACGATSGVTWGTINGNSNFTTTCTSAGWLSLENDGCVFLPAAGYRGSNATSVSYAGSDGYYTYISYWHRLRFDSSGVDPKQNTGYAGAVRLAHVIN